MDEASIEDLHNVLSSYKEKYREIKNEIEDLSKEENKLKKELETVRNHLNYYESLVSDMKKKIQGRKNLDFLDHL